MRHTAIVTGTSSGLGAQLALLLIEKGYVVIGVSRSASATLAHCGDDFIEILGDVTREDTRTRAIVAAKDAGTYDLLINCAGFGVFGGPGDLAPQEIEACINTNLTSLIQLSELSVDLLVASGGTLVNVASTAGLRAKANEAVYCASKWGVRGYTESLKAECKGKNIRVMGVYPGGMQTAFWDATEHTKDKRAGFMDAADVAKAVMVGLDVGGSCAVTDVVLEAG